MPLDEFLYASRSHLALQIRHLPSDEFRPMPLGELSDAATTLHKIIERWGAYTTPYRGEIAAPNLHMLKQFAIAKYCRLVTNQWMNRLSKGYIKFTL